MSRPTLQIQADTDGSGVIDYTEFLAATLDKKVYVQACTLSREGQA